MLEVLGKTHGAVVVCVGAVLVIVVNDSERDEVIEDSKPEVVVELSLV